MCGLQLPELGYWCYKKQLQLHKTPDGLEGPFQLYYSHSNSSGKLFFLIQRKLQDILLFLFLKKVK